MATGFSFGNTLFEVGGSTIYWEGRGGGERILKLEGRQIGCFMCLWLVGERLGTCMKHLAEVVM
jgi:hypothetical protein